MGRKLAMVGYAASRDEAPWQDPDFDIWIMNDMYELAPRYDAVFDIHDIAEIRSRLGRAGKGSHYEALKTLTKPVYMQEYYPEIPASIRFPLTELVQKYHIPAMGDKLFMTCTVAYMLALAIDEGKWDQIHLYGIDEAVDGEYKDEMPSVLYWLGLAAGRGIRIEVSAHSPLLKGWYLYGYEEPKKRQFTAFLDGEIKRVDGIREQAVRIQQEYRDEQMKCAGAVAILEHIKKLTTKI